MHYESFWSSLKNAVQIIINKCASKLSFTYPKALFLENSKEATTERDVYLN